VKIKDFQDTTIYVGLDIHANSWSAYFLSEHVKLKQMNISPPNSKKLVGYLQSNYPGATYRCAYEAGYQGFWIYDELQKLGIETMVVHAADIPTTDKERRFKDDKRDSRKIALALRSGLLEGIHVHTPQQIKDRNIVRHRHTIQGDVTRVKNRIRSHLSFMGPVPSKEEIGQYWSNNMVRALRQKAEQEENKALELLLNNLEYNRKLCLEANREVRKLSRAERYCTNAELLCSIPGVGTLTAMTFLTELGDVSRFNCDRLHAYCGLIPISKSSGERDVKSRMTKRGNKYLKTKLVLSAWVAIRTDPELTAAYEKYCKRMKGQQAIIRIAKKQANRMRSVLLKQERFTRI